MSITNDRSILLLSSLQPQCQAEPQRPMHASQATDQACLQAKREAVQLS